MKSILKTSQGRVELEEDSPLRFLKIKNEGAAAILRQEVIQGRHPSKILYSLHVLFEG